MKEITTRKLWSDLVIKKQDVAVNEGLNLWVKIKPSFLKLGNQIIERWDSADSNGICHDFFNRF